MSVSSSGVEEDVMRIKKRLEKMMKLNEVDVSTSKDMLNTLKKLPIDLHILKNTGIGVALNNLRKSCNSEELGTLAKALLKNWKKLVSSEGQQQQQLNTAASSPNSNSNDSTKPPTSPPANNSSSNSNLTNGSTTGNSTVNATNNTNTNNNKESLKRSLSGSPDNETNNKPVKHFNSNNHNTNNSVTKTEDKTNNTNGYSKEKTATTTTTTTTNNNNNNNLSSANGKQTETRRYNPLAQRISFTETKDPVRLKCREMLANALEVTEPIENGAALCDVNELANRCEDVIFNEFKNVDTKYKNRIRSRVINLKDSKNPKLRENVRLGLITPDKLATMTSDEMASDELKEQRAKFTKEAIDDHQMARAQGSKTSLLSCGKCKKNNVSYTEMQTRSADEPMTTFAYCLECGHRWKFG